MNIGTSKLFALQVHAFDNFPQMMAFYTRISSSFNDYQF